MNFMKNSLFQRNLEQEREEEMPEAVSYIHLEVYKRQISDRYMWNGKMEARWL